MNGPMKFSGDEIVNEIVNKLATKFSLERIVKKFRNVFSGKVIHEGDTISITLSYRITVAGNGGLKLEPISVAETTPRTGVS